MSNWARKADLWTGLFCLLVGLALVTIGLDYPTGTGGRIGPGYVPRLLGGLLIALGGVLAARSLWSAELTEIAFDARAISLTLASVLAFAIVFSWTGLFPAVAATVLVATFASRENGWRAAVFLAALLGVFSWAVFIAALRLPMPVFWR